MQPNDNPKDSNANPTENNAPGTQPAAPGAAAPVRVRAGKYGELEQHELLHLIDAIDQERERARFRESLYISFFVWVLVAWFVFYGPRMLWHQPVLISPADILKKRELTELLSPNLPKLSTPEVKTKPAPRPTIDDKTMEKLKAMAKQPAPAPVPATPQPVEPTPAGPPPPPAPTPQPHTPPPVVADAPNVQPTKPNFGTPSSASNAIQNAIHASAHDRGGGGVVRPSPRSGPLNFGGTEILSDTQGVDFSGYLRRLHVDVQRNWDLLLPAETLPPLSKQGEAWIRVTILPDGTIGDMKLDGSSHDDAINKSCWGSITSEGQFPPLPKEFHGPGLVLRFHYMVNKGWVEE